MKKYSEELANDEDYVKAQIVAALTSGRHHVDYVALRTDSTGHFRVNAAEVEKHLDNEVEKREKARIKARIEKSLFSNARDAIKAGQQEAPAEPDAPLQVANAGVRKAPVSLDALALERPKKKPAAPQNAHPGENNPAPANPENQAGGEGRKRSNSVHRNH